ncbi:hypothetical protein HN51_010675 [Arachis hypogaea]
MIQIPQSKSLLFQCLLKCLKIRFLPPFIHSTLFHCALAYIGKCNHTYFFYGFFEIYKRLFYLSIYSFQKDAMESSVEIVIEKLLNVTKDRVPKVWNACKPSVDDTEQPNHEIDVLYEHENDWMCSSISVFHISACASLGISCKTKIISKGDGIFVYARASSL